MTSRMALASVASLVLVAVSTPAFAQDDARLRVQVHVVVPHEAVHEIVRLQTQIAREISSEIRDAVKDLVDGLRWDFQPGRQTRQSGSSDWRAEATDRETHTLALGAAGSLDLRNLSGEITVTAGSGRDVVVEVIRRSRGRTDADAKLGLDRVKVAVDQRTERATVREVYPSETRAPYTVSTAFHVTAPVGTRIAANTVSSNVTITGIHGDVAVSTMSGDVVISDAARLSMVKTISGSIKLSSVDMPDSTLTLGSVSGDVSIAQINTRRLEASSVSGSVTARNISTEDATITSMTGTVDYAGSLSSHGRYQLQTHSGTVSFRPSGARGYELQANTFSGEIRTEIPVPLQSSGPGRSPRRAIRATVGDASAVVVLTTFSGSIVVGK